MAKYMAYRKFYRTVIYILYVSPLSLFELFIQLIFYSLFVFILSLPHSIADDRLENCKAKRRSFLCLCPSVLSGFLFLIILVAEIHNHQSGDVADLPSEIRFPFRPWPYIAPKERSGIAVCCTQLLCLSFSNIGLLIEGIDALVYTLVLQAFSWGIRHLPLGFLVLY